jgi:hypothetical protein
MTPPATVTCDACNRKLPCITQWPVHCVCGHKIAGDATSIRYEGCRHRGLKLRMHNCGCAGDTAIHACDLHGECMTRKLKPNMPVEHFCNVCEDRDDWKPGEVPKARYNYPPITTRNLIYHIYPHGSWLDAVRETAVHVDVFNGRRLVAIAVDSDMDIEAVREIVTPLLKPTQLFVMPNDKDLRETVTFEPLLRAVLNDSQAEATFYAHSKANTTDGNVDAATVWRQVMTANLLGRWQDAMRHLQSHVFVGTHKMIWPSHQPSPFPTRLKPNHPWMHSGTFWWFRHDEVSLRYKPEMVARDRYAVEAFPGQLVPHEMAYSMWQPWDEHESAWPQRFPYDPGLYDTDYSR